MTPEENKTLERLIHAVETTMSSPAKLFWRGLLLGLGKGIGSIIGWLLLLAILIYLFKISGLENTFKDLVGVLEKISHTVR